MNLSRQTSQSSVQPSMHTASPLRKWSVKKVSSMQSLLALVQKAQKQERLRVLCACSVEGMLCARLYTKGAAELLLQQCSSRLAADTRAERLSQGEKSGLLDSFAADGNRFVSLPSPHMLPAHSLWHSDTLDDR